MPDSLCNNVSYDCVEFPCSNCDALISKRLDEAASYMIDAYNALGKAADCIDVAFLGRDPGYPSADSVNARAWDYVDVIQSARYDLNVRFDNWEDNYDA